MNFSLFAQDDNCDSGWCWGSDPGTAKHKHAEYNDNFKFAEEEGKLQLYKDAIEPLEWLLANTPNLNKSIYQNGVKIYNILAKEETDAEQKIKYQDRALELYDLRIKYYGEEAKVLSSKGYKAYNYLIKRKPNRYEELFNLYDKILELNQEKTKRYHLTILMNLVKIQYQTKKLDKDQVLEYYDKIMNE